MEYLIVLFLGVTVVLLLTMAYGVHSTLTYRCRRCGNALTASDDVKHKVCKSCEAKHRRDAVDV